MPVSLEVYASVLDAWTRQLKGQDAVSAESGQVSQQRHPPARSCMTVAKLWYFRELKVALLFPRGILQKSYINLFIL